MFFTILLIVSVILNNYNRKSQRSVTFNLVIRLECVIKILTWVIVHVNMTRPTKNLETLKQWFSDMGSFDVFFADKSLKFHTVTYNSKGHNHLFENWYHLSFEFSLQKSILFAVLLMKWCKYLSLWDQRIFVRISKLLLNLSLLLHNWV
jgi:hypothetical protein